MAIGPTIHSFSIALSDVDRGVYETLDLKVARHPSETLDYLVTRVLAYCLEYEEGISFTRGVSEGDEPAIWVRDLTGKLTAWIEVGSPAAAKVHRARKAVPRVAIYVHRDLELLRRKLAGEAIHRAAEIPLVAFERSFLDALGAGIERRTSLDVSVNDRHLYVTIGGKTLETVIVEQRIE